MGASEVTKKKAKSPQEEDSATGETPIFHPSQAEGERGMGLNAENGAESRPRPSQAEGERE